MEGADNGQKQSPESKTNDEAKIQALKNEIKDLRDNNPENDWFNAEIMTNNELNSSLTEALLNNRKTLNNLVKELSKIIEKNPSTTTEARNLLILLQWVQEKAEFNRLNGIMSAERINLNDLWKFNDQEIKLVCDYIKKNYWTKEIVSFREKMKRIDYSAQSIKIENKKAASNYQLIKDAMSSFSDNPQEQLKNMELNEIFENIKADKLKELAKNYLGIDDWKGEEIPRDTPIIIEADKRWLYSSQEFVWRFNTVNESRKSNNEKIADDFSLSDDAFTGDILNDFKVIDNKLQYKWKPYENWNITAVFWEKHINPALNKWDFIWAEKATIESKICDKIADAIKDKLQNSDQAVNSESWKMSIDNFNQIKSALWDKMFINMDDHDNVTYIPQKAKNYLWEFRGKEWANIKQTFRTPEWMAYVAALQILLNADYGANIKVDGKWTDRGETREAVRNFQNAYNNKGTDWVNLNTDGLPWKRTLEALLDGQYGDTKLDWQWEISQDWTKITFLKWSGITIDHDHTWSFITIDNVRYYERKKGMDGNWYQIGVVDWLSYLYTWPFKNGLMDWEKWTITRANWNKYVWEFKDGERSWKWTFTLPSWTKYEWDFVNWNFEWKWTYTWADWGKYVWDFVNWNFEWKWTRTWADWDKYEWDFVNDKLSWKWTFTWSNWNILTGTRNNGHISEGKVTLKWTTTELNVTRDETKESWMVTSEWEYKGHFISDETWEFVDTTNTTPEKPAEKDPAVVEWIWKFEGDTFKFDNVNELNGNKYVNIKWKNYFEYRNGMNGDWYIVVPKTEQHSAYVLYWHYENGVIMNWTVHDAEGNKYEWEFKDGKRSWNWTATMLDWTVLSCNTFVEGLPAWKCTIEYWSSDEWKDGLGKRQKYEWELKDGKPSKWKMTWENWATYEWARENGVLNWKWVLTLNEEKFDWEFKDGLPIKWTLTMPEWTFEWDFVDWKPTSWKYTEKGSNTAVDVTFDWTWFRTNDKYVWVRKIEQKKWVSLYEAFYKAREGVNK